MKCLRICEKKLTGSLKVRTFFYEATGGMFSLNIKERYIKEKEEGRVLIYHYVCPAKDRRVVIDEESK